MSQTIMPQLEVIQEVTKEETCDNDDQTGENINEDQEMKDFE